MLQYCADVDAPFLEDDDKRGIKQGMTALHLAAKFTRANSMELLLACEPKLNAQDRNGNTPLHYAVRCTLPCTLTEVS